MLGTAHDYQRAGTVAKQADGMMCLRRKLKVQGSAFASHSSPAQMVLCRETRLTGCSVAPSPTIAPGRVETRLPRPVLSTEVGVPLSSSSEMPVCNRAVVCQQSVFHLLSKLPFDAPSETLRALRAAAARLLCVRACRVPVAPPIVP